MKKYNYTSTFTYEGKRYYVYADTKEELGFRKANKLRDLKSNDKILSPKTTVSQWRQECYEVYKSGLSDKGKREAEYRYDKYIEGVIGNLPISKVTAIQCQKVLNQCAGMSFSQCDKLRQELRFIFQKALENELIRKNPANNLTMPESNRGKRRSITDSEREALYKAYDKYLTEDGYNIKGGLHPFILFIVMLETGCRPSEAVGLLGKDIDHKQKLLHIRGTKTECSDRYVPIPSTLYPLIKEVKPFEPICPNAKGNIHTEKSYARLSEHLRREMNIAMGCKVYRNQIVPPFPLADDFTPYCLRHTYCTDLCKAKVDVRTAQKLMGHANISVTADIYTHVDEQQILDAGELIDRYSNSIRRMVN